MSTVTLLGPQFRTPILRDVLRELQLSGPFVSISAGWQEREGELDELRAHLDADVHDLHIYERSEAVFAADAPLRDAHRQRQNMLREMQELYQLQLEHAKTAIRELFERDGGNSVVRCARREALGALRRLDRAHWQAIRRVHREFAQKLNPTERPAVRVAAARIAAYVAEAKAILITGGHVAVLLNRLRLLGGERLFANKPLIAWSAGAMALSEAVVLFHDQPPQGRANAAVLDVGLGCVRGILPLPHAQSRLKLHDATRVETLSRRFAPHACLTLDDGAWLHFVDGSLTHCGGSFRLARDGSLAEPLAYR
jgi:peptidase E